MNKKGMITAKILAIIFVPGVFTAYCALLLAKFTKKFHSSKKEQKEQIEQ